MNIDNKNENNDNQDSNNEVTKNEDVQVKENENNKESENKDLVPKDKKSDQDLDELLEQMNKLIDEMSNEYGVDPDKIKVLPVPKMKFTFLSIFVSSIVCQLFDFVLWIALSAIPSFAWCTYEKKVYVILFALFFALSEVVLKICSLPLFKIKTKSILLLSFFKVLPFLLTAVLCAIIPVFITRITSYFVYVIICLLIYAIRKFYTTYFLEKQMNSILQKGMPKRTKKKKDDTEE